MKKMFIYEPAMCCPTGLCGISVNPELLRLSTVASTLQKNGVEIKRYNLTNSPMEFVVNRASKNEISFLYRKRWGWKNFRCLFYRRCSC